MSNPRAPFRPCAVHLAPAREHLAAQLAALDLYLAKSTPEHFASWVAATDAAELWAASTAASCPSCRNGAILAEKSAALDCPVCNGAGRLYGSFGDRDGECAACYGEGTLHSWNVPEYITPYNGDEP
jgi:hypothetical protein